MTTPNDKPEPKRPPFIRLHPFTNDREADLCDLCGGMRLDHVEVPAAPVATERPTPCPECNNLKRHRDGCKYGVLERQRDELAERLAESEAGRVQAEKERSLACANLGHADEKIGELQDFIKSQSADITAARAELQAERERFQKAFAQGAGWCDERAAMTAKLQEARRERDEANSRSERELEKLKALFNGIEDSDPITDKLEKWQQNIEATLIADLATARTSAETSAAELHEARRTADEAVMRMREQADTCSAELAALREDRDGLEKESAITVRELDELKLEIEGVISERDRAVAFASKVERGEVHFAKKLDEYMAQIVALSLGKTINESIADAVARVLSDRYALAKALESLRDLARKSMDDSNGGKSIWSSHVLKICDAAIRGGKQEGE